MARPALRMATGSYQAEVLLRDDDPSPPSLRMLSEEVVYDSLQGPYRFKVQISDPGGLEKPGVKWIFGEGQPKSFDSFGGQVGDEYFVDIPRDQWVNRIGETMTIFVSAKDADRERDGDQSSVVDSFKVRIEDDDVSGPNIVQFVTRRGENMQFQVLVKLEDESGVFVSESWPKLYYSFKGPVSPDSFDGIAKMVAAPKYGPGWFTAVAPWGEQGALKAAAAEERKTDTFIYFKVRSYDLDKDREKDDLESWSDSWAEVYLPAPLADSKTIFDIWPAGDREAGVNSLWDDWFDPPPSYVPSSLFFEGRPAEVSPEPVPEVLTGATARVRIHVAVSLAFVNIGATLNITGASLSLAPYKLTAAIVSKKGVWNLGALSFPSEEEAGGTTEVKLAVPPGALSTGENIVVLIPSPGTGEYDQLALERIHLEANELPEPPKIEE